MIKKDSFTDRIIAFMAVILVICVNIICGGSFVVLKLFMFTSPDIPIWYNIYVWLLCFYVIVAICNGFKLPFGEDSMFFLAVSGRCQLYYDLHVLLQISIFQLMALLY